MNRAGEKHDDQKEWVDPHPADCLPENPHQALRTVSLIHSILSLSDSTADFDENEHVEADNNEYGGKSHAIVRDESKLGVAVVIVCDILQVILALFLIMLALLSTVFSASASYLFFDRNVIVISLFF